MMKQGQGWDWGYAPAVLATGKNLSCESADAPILCMSYGALTRREALSAVLPGLQLKFQDLGCTVTNWESSR